MENLFEIHSFGPPSQEMPYQLGKGDRGQWVFSDHYPEILNIKSSYQRIQFLKEKWNEKYGVSDLIDKMKPHAKWILLSKENYERYKHIENTMPSVELKDNEIKIIINDAI